MVAIDDLPEEMLLEIFEKLSLFDLVVNCSKTCPKWKDIIDRHILGPNIRFANMDAKFKMVVQENDGWTEESNATDLMSRPGGTISGQGVPQKKVGQDFFFFFFLLL